jgi:hypothetical protein
MACIRSALIVAVVFALRVSYVTNERQRCARGLDRIGVIDVT